MTKKKQTKKAYTSRQISGCSKEKWKAVAVIKFRFLLMSFVCIVDRFDPSADLLNGHC